MMSGLWYKGRFFFDGYKIYKYIKSRNLKSFSSHLISTSKYIYVYDGVSSYL